MVGFTALLASLVCLIYVGQTDRRLKQRYFEHIRYIRYNNPQSIYVNHIFWHAREFGSTQNTMTLIYSASKGHFIDIL